MGFWDFQWLNDPVGGFTTTQPEGYSDLGFEAGFNSEQTPNSQMTWGQLLGTLSRMSNSNGGQQLGQWMGQQYGSIGQGVPGYNTPVQIYRIPQPPPPQQERQSQTSMGDVMAIGQMAGMMF